jgi:hypothetical protein
MKMSLENTLIAWYHILVVRLSNNPGSQKELFFVNKNYVLPLYAIVKKSFPSMLVFKFLLAF